MPPQRRRQSTPRSQSETLKLVHANSVPDVAGWRPRRNLRVTYPKGIRSSRFPRVWPCGREELRILVGPHWPVVFETEESRVVSALVVPTLDDAVGIAFLDTGLRRSSNAAESHCVGVFLPPRHVQRGPRPVEPLSACLESVRKSFGVVLNHVPRQDGVGVPECVPGNIIVRRFVSSLRIPVLSEEDGAGRVAGRDQFPVLLAGEEKEDTVSWTDAVSLGASAPPSKCDAVFGDGVPVCTALCLVPAPFVRVPEEFEGLRSPGFDCFWPVADDCLGVVVAAVVDQRILASVPVFRNRTLLKDEDGSGWKQEFFQRLQGLDTGQQENVSRAAAFKSRVEKQLTDPAFGVEQNRPALEQPEHVIEILDFPMREVRRVFVVHRVLGELSG